MEDPETVARGICLRALTGTPKTRKQLADLLAKKEVPAEAAAAVLDRFTEVGLIDDAAFAAAWVSTRQSGRGLARRALASELRAKGVDGEVAAAAVAEVDPQDEWDSPPAGRAQGAVDVPAGPGHRRAAADGDARPQGLWRRAGRVRGPRGVGRRRRRRRTPQSKPRTRSTATARPRTRPVWTPAGPPRGRLPGVGSRQRPPMPVRAPRWGRGGPGPWGAPVPPGQVWEDDLP